MRHLYLVSLLIAALIAIVLSQDTIREQVREIVNDVYEELMEDGDNDMSTSCRVTASNGLNMRSSPGGSVVYTLPSGASVSKISSAGYSSGYNWAQVSYSGRTGYVADNFISCSSYSGGGSTGGSSGRSGDQGCDRSKTKQVESLEKIFGHEGSCQNWSNDRGNQYQGRIGYTCAGIIPSVGVNNRNGVFSYAASRCPANEMFVKCAYDMDRRRFIDGSAQIYLRDYARPGGCANLPQPIYYVCLDIAVNSGPGRSSQFLRELGSFSGSDASGYARRLNELHRQFYRRIGAPGTSNNRFLNGWLRRADDRDSFIQRCG